MDETDQQCHIMENKIKGLAMFLNLIRVIVKFQSKFCVRLVCNQIKGHFWLE